MPLHPTLTATIIADAVLLHGSAMHFHEPPHK
jgi:hypothetical protein